MSHQKQRTVKITYYSPTEERLNIWSHAFGLLLSIIGLPLLILQACFNGNVWHIVSFSIYGSSLILLYLASTLYHKATQDHSRVRMQIFDHAAIFILIAGTYTPFSLVTLNGTTGWLIFGIIWGLAITGVILKLFFTGRYNLLSTSMYVLMGWIIIFAIQPLVQNLPSGGITWLVAGGVAYTVGAIFYMIKRIRYNHAIFHVFVLLGSLFHFLSIYLYV